jgi:Fe-S-cluster containining protein
MSKKFARRQLDALYAEMPALECQGKCAEACGPIAMTRVEWERITDRGPVGSLAADLTCPLLVDERCSVYDVRPTICRLWGMVESMPCEWGCKPTRMLTNDEGRVFLERVGVIGA